MGKYEQYKTLNFNSFNADKVKVGVVKSATSGKVVQTKVLSLVSQLGQTKTINGGALKLKMTKKQPVSSYITIKDFCDRRGRTVSSFKFTERAVYERLNADPNPPAWEEPNTSHENPKGYFLKKSDANGYPNFNTLSAQYDIFAKTTKPPTYVKGKFYLKVQDHFASLIEKAKEQLANELDELESATGQLNLETYEFDVGDMLGGINPLTNEPFKSVVTKKIAKIDSFKASVSYEIG